MFWLAPVLAVALTMLTGGLVFTLIGHDGVAVVREIFVSPLADPNRWQDLGVKAAPLSSSRPASASASARTSGTSARRAST
jgi:simple sugar transport system permease protein